MQETYNIRLFFFFNRRGLSSPQKEKEGLFDYQILILSASIRTPLMVALSWKAGFIPINLLHIADIQIVVAHSGIFFQAADNGNTAVDREFFDSGINLSHIILLDTGTFFAAVAAKTAFTSVNVHSPEKIRSPYCRRSAPLQ